MRAESSGTEEDGKGEDRCQVTTCVVVEATRRKRQVETIANHETSSDFLLASVSV